MRKYSGIVLPPQSIVQMPVFAGDDKNNEKLYTMVHTTTVCIEDI